MPNSDGVETYGLKKLSALFDRVESFWKIGMFAILKKNNPQLLMQLESVEDKISTMLHVERPAKEQKKQFDKAIEEYGKLLTMCAEYATRYLK